MMYSTILANMIDIYIIFICSHTDSFIGNNILVNTLGNHSYVKWAKNENIKAKIMEINLIFFVFILKNMQKTKNIQKLKGNLKVLSYIIIRG